MVSFNKQSFVISSFVRTESNYSYGRRRIRGIRRKWAGSLSFALSVFDRSVAAIAYRSAMVKMRGEFHKTGSSNILDINRQKQKCKNPSVYLEKVRMWNDEQCKGKWIFLNYKKLSHSELSVSFGGRPRNYDKSGRSVGQYAANVATVPYTKSSRLHPFRS